MPPFLRSQVGLIWVAMGLGVAGTPMLMALLRPVWPVPFMYLGFEVGYLAVVVALALRWRRRFVARLAAADSRLCFRCGYNISTLGDTGVCPECGDAFDVEVLRGRWAKAGYFVNRRDK